LKVHLGLRDRPGKMARPESQGKKARKVPPDPLVQLEPPDLRGLRDLPVQRALGVRRERRESQRINKIHTGPPQLAASFISAFVKTYVAQWCPASLAGALSRVRHANI
jgi:hypothetical protein